VTAALAARQPPRKRAVAVSAVVLGHVAVLLLVWQEKFATRPASEARRTIAIRLVPQPLRERPRAEQLVRQAAQPVRSTPVPSIEADSERSSILVPTASTAPAADGVGPPAASTGMGAAAPGPAASGALVLTPSREVLRGALANAATTDPRSNSPKPTFEERIAMGADPELCVKLERLPDGSVRRSMGRLAQAETLLQQAHNVGARGTTVCQ